MHYGTVHHTRGIIHHPPFVAVSSMEKKQQVYLRFTYVFVMTFVVADSLLRGFSQNRDNFPIYRVPI